MKFIFFKNLFNTVPNTISSIRTMVPASWRSQSVAQDRSFTCNAGGAGVQPGPGCSGGPGQSGTAYREDRTCGVVKHR